jgi:hypothetical protein
MLSIVLKLTPLDCEKTEYDNDPFTIWTPDKLYHKCIKLTAYDGDA